MDPAGALPNLVIVGAAKCGTTSLHSYLALHPEIFMSEVKELHFFDRDDWRARLPWYRAQFRSERPVRGESSPTYSLDPVFGGVPARIAEVAPEARIVYLVRDPLERLVAHYVEMHSLYQEDRSLDEAVRDFESPANLLVAGSRYGHQLARYREHFASDRILVLDQRDLLRARRETLREAFAFLGVDPAFATPGFDAVHNVRGGKRRLTRLGWWLHRRGVLVPARARTRALPPAFREALKGVVSYRLETPELDPALRAALEAHLHADAERLREMTGKAFSHWSV